MPDVAVDPLTAQEAMLLAPRTVTVTAAFLVSVTDVVLARTVIEPPTPFVPRALTRVLWGHVMFPPHEPAEAGAAAAIDPVAIRAVVTAVKIARKVSFFMWSFFSFELKLLIWIPNSDERISTVSWR